MNKDIQDSINELHGFAVKSTSILNDLETYLLAKDLESESADLWYEKNKIAEDARQKLQKVAGDQLAEIIMLVAALKASRERITDQQKTINIYQDVADAIVRKGVALEEQILVLKKNQKKPRKKRTKKVL
jgi:hypothetical protein